MPKLIVPGTVFTLLVWMTHASAGIHLGMKLACKKYGDAWAAKDRNALMQAVTEDFATVWDRVPDKLFQDLPRCKSGDTYVLASHKSTAEALVQVATPEGNITFALEGSGFSWKVADLYVPNTSNEVVSLKSALSVSMSAREFLQGLNDPRDRAFGQCLSSSFRSTVAYLTPGDWRRVRTYLPGMNEPPPTCRPNVSFRGNTAVMKTTIPGGAVTLTFVREGIWRVSDLRVEGDGMKIPSFSGALPSLASVAALGEFFNDVKRVDPVSFTAPGKLQQELVQAHNGGPAPPNPANKKLEYLMVAENSRRVYLKYPDKWVLVDTKPEPGQRNLISAVHLHEAGAWRNAADLLALNRKVKESPLGNWLTQLNDKKN